MKSFLLTSVILACGITCSLSIHAETLSKEQYDAETKKIESKYIAEKVKCISLSGHENGRCVAEAESKKHAAMAIVNGKFRPPADSKMHPSTLKIDSDYLLAIEKCAGKAQKQKDACKKTAKSIKDEKFEYTKK